MPSTTNHPAAAIAGLALAGLVLAGCGSSGPDGLMDGSYEAYASSAAPVPSATLELFGSAVSIVDEGGGSQDLILTDGSAEFVLCPPDGSGRPSELSGSVTIGTLTLVRPAMFGNCGVTRPMRVTVVDLDAVDESAFPFTRWVEFCNTSDPDC